MHEVAPDVFHIPLVPRDGINAYLIGPVLVDAGLRSSFPALRRAIGRRPLAAHVLTHGHSDHQGSSAAICAAYGVPLWCGEHARGPVERGDVVDEFPDPHHPVARLQQRFVAGPACRVTRVLREGDEVAGFRVIETPGHARGHIALWRERDGVLIAGDVLTNMHLVTTAVGLREPPRLFTSDVAQNRMSIRRIAALAPRLVCFGHGPVLRDASQLHELAARLPGGTAPRA